MPNYLPVDDRASSAAHALGFLASACLVAYSPELAISDRRSERLAVFAITLMVVYAVSALLHADTSGHASVLDRLDRAAIYLLIAGTYALFAWGSASPWVVVGIWVSAATLACATLVFNLNSWWPYVAFGWTAVVALIAEVSHMHELSLALLLTGALAYTVGIRYFLSSGSGSLPHFKWHLFVLAGSASHTTAAFV